jgi:hypothetical protein
VVNNNALVKSYVVRLDYVQVEKLHTISVTKLVETVRQMNRKCFPLILQKMLHKDEKNYYRENLS